MGPNHPPRSRTRRSFLAQACVSVLLQEGVDGRTRHHSSRADFERVQPPGADQPHVAASETPSRSSVACSQGSARSPFHAACSSEATDLSALFNTIASSAGL